MFRGKWDPVCHLASLSRAALSMIDVFCVCPELKAELYHKESGRMRYA